MSGSCRHTQQSHRVARTRLRIRCQHHMIRFSCELHHREEAFSSAYSHRMPPVFSLQSGSSSAKIPSLYGIHRKMAAFLIVHIDTNRQCLDPLRECRVSVAQSPASRALDSSFRHSLFLRGEAFSDHQRSVLCSRVFSASARRPLCTDRCQPQVVRNLFADHVL